MIARIVHDNKTKLCVKIFTFWPFISLLFVDPAKNLVLQLLKSNFHKVISLHEHNITSNLAI